MNETEAYNRQGTPVITAWDIPGGIFNPMDKKPITSQTAISVLDEKKSKLPPDYEETEGTEPVEDTTCCNDVSGFKYVSGSDISTFRRVFWLLVTVGALSGLLLQIYRSTSKFAERGTNTKVEYVQMDELDFPSVTICNTNMFKLGTLSEFYGGWMGAFCHGVVYVRQMFPEPGISSTMQGANYEVTEYPAGLSLMEFIEESAHSVEDMVKFCQFNGRECSFENFTTTITNYGICFTFNSAENEHKISTKTPGKTLGLSLVLDAGENEVVAAPRESIGFKMLVHPRGEFPNLQDYGIELQPGTHTPIRLDVTQMFAYAPYGKCGSSNLKYTDAFFDDSYTENKCHLECVTDYIVKQCGCRSFYMPGDAAYCSPVELQCYYSEMENRNTLCSCPKQCVKTQYNPTMSQMTFPSSGVATTFHLRNEFEMIAIGFSEAVTASGGTEMDNDFMNMFMTIQMVISMTNISNGNQLSDVYPMTSMLLAQCYVMNIFGNIHYELFITFSKTVFYEVMGTYDDDHVAVNFTEEFNSHAEKYLHSDISRQCLDGSFSQSGEYTGDVTSKDFQDFLDNIEDYLYVNDTFFELYTSIYEDVHALVLKHGLEVYNTQDFVDLTTDYMRKNLVHVDVFYGDLQVENIIEQPSYELFQFICDLGGAIGLFFGASILSFIETAEYWFSLRCGSKKDTK